MLPESNEVSSQEKETLKSRYRYYMSVMSYKGREKPGPEEIKNAEFFFGEDSLNRWFTGTPNRKIDGQKEPYEPAIEIIAAVRDFLIIMGYVTEIELQIDSPDIALAYVLNDCTGYDYANTQSESPHFLPVYQSIFFEHGLLSVYTIVFDNLKEVGRIQFHIEKHITKFHSNYKFPEAFQNFSYATAKSSQIKVGWISVGFLPAMVSLSKFASDTESVVILNHLVPTRIIKNSINIFDWRSLTSYEFDDDVVAEFRPEDHFQPFVHSEYEHKLEFFEDLCHTRYSGIFSSFKGDEYKFRMTAEKNNYTKEDMESGKALYNSVLNIVKILQSEDRRKLADLDFEEPAQLIEQGANVNYWDPFKQTTTLHLAAGTVLRDTLDAMMAVDGLDYLVKDRNGRLPADIAFFGSSEYGSLLTEKQTAQANERGISIPELIARDPGPVIP